MILAYCRAYEISGKEIYQDVAQKTAAFILREMTDPEGGFYSAQDADSEGVEGKYYLFEPEEIIGILGEEAGGVFNQYFDITKNGNFEGKNIPNLLGNVIETDILDSCLPEIYEYRKNRYALHLDDKILTSWNGLMIAAMCSLYRVSKEEIYLEAAKKAQEFIFENLYEGENLYVSFRKGQRSKKGFLDDYANMIFALLALYDAVLDQTYLEKAKKLCEKAVRDFYDSKKGGFFLYGKENEQLIMRPKETYDGAVPSGNSIMAYNLVRLSLLLEEKEYRRPAKAQLDYMSAEAAHYPAGYAMFLNVLSDYFELPEKITVVLKDRQDIEKLSLQIPLGTVVKILEGPTEEFPLKNDRTTFYVCRGRSCLPPVNTL